MYRIGTQLKIKGQIYFIQSVETVKGDTIFEPVRNKVLLANGDLLGTRWDEPQLVNNQFKITKEELESLIREDPFSGSTFLYEVLN